MPENSTISISPDTFNHFTSSAFVSASASSWAAGPVPPLACCRSAEESSRLSGSSCPRLQPPSFRVFLNFSTKIKSAEHCQNLFAHHFWNSKQVSITCWQLCSHGVGLFEINKDLAITQNFAIPFPYQHLRNQSLPWFMRKMFVSLIWITNHIIDRTKLSLSVVFYDGYYYYVIVVM